jgi:hypothetical protein
MAESWGPVGHPTTEGKTVGSPDGEIVSASNGGVNYDATDGRHSKPDHEGWKSVDPMSGSVSDTDWADQTGRFADGPGPWRQT